MIDKKSIEKHEAPRHAPNGSTYHQRRKIRAEEVENNLPRRHATPSFASAAYTSSLASASEFRKRKKKSYRRQVSLCFFVFLFCFASLAGVHVSASVNSPFSVDLQICAFYLAISEAATIYFASLILFRYLQSTVPTS